MRPVLSFFLLFASVVGGFFLNGGHPGLLWHPGEYIIVLGAAASIFLISYPFKVGFQAFGAIRHMIKPLYSPEKFEETLCLMAELKIHLEANGSSGLDEHLNKPEASPLFQRYPRVLKDKNAVSFIVDNFRLLETGTEQFMAHELEAIINADIKSQYTESLTPSKAMSSLTEVMPSIGIVAAVLGMNVTMMFIDQEPAVVGAKIGAALFGTFLGIFSGYGVFYPLSAGLGKIAEQRREYLTVIKSFLMAMVNDYALFVTAEVARKQIQPGYRPDFQHLRNRIQEILTKANES
ncbi:motility-associated protein [Ferrimonas marina]|uniref:Chemotaxis protein MotA n=1 Tax=Ferrimonas marina TaxID=299255 RepID=A0A1M5TER9_9GAMM|nr:motility-associated protein [Ferrimonas marina]SHH49140.1 chemotaxis protein MotA [Ferrimonas marina]